MQTVTGSRGPVSLSSKCTCELMTLELTQHGQLHKLSTARVPF